MRKINLSKIRRSMMQDKLPKDTEDRILDAIDAGHGEVVNNNIVMLEDSVRKSIIEQNASITEIAKRVTDAGKSMAKTHLLRIDRASSEHQKARLDVCANCPGNHAVWNVTVNGKEVKIQDRQEAFEKDINNKPRLYTCGKMIESLKKEGKGTCGCLLESKTLDKKQECPFGYWSEVDEKFV